MVEILQTLNHIDKNTQEFLLMLSIIGIVLIYIIITNITKMIVGRSKKVIKTQKFKKSNVEKCIICDGDTPYDKYIHIEKRKNYIIGLGQLCNSCYEKIYNHNDQN